MHLVYESFSHNFLSCVVLLLSFLKKDTDTGLWHEMGDDTAREKASQVLRDAVALLPDTSTAAVTVSQYPAAYLPPRLEPSTHQETTPALESVGSSTTMMMHPPSPDSRRKRLRYTDQPRERTIAQSDSYERYSSQVSYSPVVRHHNSVPRYRSRSAEPPPLPGRRYVRQARSDVYAHPGAAQYTQETAGAALPPVGDIQPHLNEYDLFQGELLESDLEDETGTLNHGSSHHGDLF